MRELQLYIHIPFCKKKCDYCDFLSAPAEASVRSAYVNRLAEEIAFYAPAYRDWRVGTVFFGGGTPTVLDGYQIAGLMDRLKDSFYIEATAEITAECNPGTLPPSKAAALAQAGINRLSFGLQSAQDRELRLLGRIHTFEQFLESFDAARKAGFWNINVDLMSALPGQNLSGWEKTLRTVTSLRPEHISVYSLMIEEGTPFFERYREDDLLRQKGEIPSMLPSEEEERRMYAFTEQFLASKGYSRYEISNYAKPGFACRHNIGYWSRKNYLGFGLGASSLIENVRFQNTSDLDTYMNESFSHTGETKLERKEQIEEYLFLGLRMTRGISRTDFAEKFQAPIESIYGETLHRLKDQKLIREEEGWIALTHRGIDISNRVLAEFLL